MELDHQSVLNTELGGGGGLWYWDLSALGGWINASRALVLQAHTHHHHHHHTLPGSDMDQHVCAAFYSTFYRSVKDRQD